MLAGPVFDREATVAPRQARFYVARTLYVGALALLAGTGWILITGNQEIRNLGDFARYGSMAFGLLAPLQLALALFFSALLSAVAVAQEKDRRTLELLLLTDLTNHELVLGKLLASMLNVLVLLLAALPLFVLATLLGGVTMRQIVDCFLVTLATVLAAASAGSTIALWRDKTFQSLAWTVMALVFWLALGGSLWLQLWGAEVFGLPARGLAMAISPWVIFEAARPFPSVEAQLPGIGNPVAAYVGLALLTAAALNGLAIARVRVWNPSREVRRRAAEPAEGTWEMGAPREGQIHADTTRRSVRRVWNRPILWRETCTQAYGRKTIVVRLAYVALAVLAGIVLHGMHAAPTSAAAGGGEFLLVPLGVLSLVLINAQAVTAITSERDGRTLDLLLVTQITPLEFVLGKLGGVLWNTKEMVLAPLLLAGYLGWLRHSSLEDIFCLVAGMVILVAFAATLGLHVGMAYASTRTAIGVSLGTVFFLFIGVATCMRIIADFAGSFQVQLMPFLGMMVGGSVGLYVALGVRNPSQAIAWASFLCPVVTFVGITQYLQGGNLSVLGLVAFAYGMATLAMFVPAVSEFDMAMGRTTHVEE